LRDYEITFILSTTLDEEAQEKLWVLSEKMLGLAG